jgi:hypothetical protein
VTPAVTPEVSPGTGDVLVGGAVLAMWVDEATDAAFDGTGWPDWPIQDPTPTPAPPTDAPPAATERPVVDGLVTDSDRGSLRVVEPPPSRDLLDAIVGDVLSAFLGN